MAVLAHPDDESLGAGGVLARYAAEGVETHVVTATRGESGRFRGEAGGPSHPGAEELGRIREAELRAAVAVLGVRSLDLLGYRDGALDQADPRQAVGRIAACLRRVRPHVVVTFAPDGAYGHPDHIAICQFATAAVLAAADPSHRAGPDPAAAALLGPAPESSAPHAVSKLYYMVWPEAMWSASQAVFKKLVSNVDGVERQAQPWPDWAITTYVDTRAHWPTVWSAVSCHDSQIAGYAGLRDLPPEKHEALWGRQPFYRALSTVNGGRRREADLFEGLRDTRGPSGGAEARRSG